MYMSEENNSYDNVVTSSTECTLHAVRVIRNGYKKRFSPLVKI